MALMNSTKLMMVADSFYIPKNNPAKPRGEDAHFCSQTAQVIGVADGVGGWARRGIDAGKYARQLMKNAANAVKNSRATNLNPKDILIQAFLNTPAKGSSTACIITLNGNLLRAVNLGDSGFSVIRDGKTWFKSAVQQHEFNMPYQVGGMCGDLPEEADEIVVELESGDIIVAGTDGLFDNVFDEVIEATVVTCLEEEMLPGMMARELAKKARSNSLEKNTVSPFEVAALDAGVVHRGGKYDDVTVVVGYVVPQNLYQF